MEAIYKEFLDNGDVGSLQWSWVLEPGQYEDIRFVNDNMVAVQNGSDKWGVWDLEKEILVTSCKYNNIPNDAARYYIVKTSLKLKKSLDKRKEQQAKALEKAQKAEERQKQIEAATAEKERRAEERKAQEQAAMPKKDQSHKPVKKFTKK